MEPNAYSQTPENRTKLTLQRGNFYFGLGFALIAGLLVVVGLGVLGITGLGLFPLTTAMAMTGIAISVLAVVSFVTLITLRRTLGLLSHHETALTEQSARHADLAAKVQAQWRAEQVIPVFVLEDAFRTGPDVGAARLSFLLRSLESLRRNLESLGYPLIIRHGRSVDVIPALARELKAEAVFANRRYEPYALRRDEKIFNELNAAGIGYEVFKDAVAWEEREILTQAGNPFTIFTPYSKAWKTRAPSQPRSTVAPASVTTPETSCPIVTGGLLGNSSASM